MPQGWAFFSSPCTAAVSVESRSVPAVVNTSGLPSNFSFMGWFEFLICGQIRVNSVCCILTLSCSGTLVAAVFMFCLVIIFTLKVNDFGSSSCVWFQGRLIGCVFVCQCSMNVDIHMDFLHCERLDSTCIMRGERSKRWSNSKSAKLCRNYALKMGKCYGLHISNETNSTLYKLRMFCSKYYIRLHKLKNSIHPSEGQLVSYLVFWAESTIKDYIMAKNNVQSVSYLLCMQAIKPQII